MSKSLKVAVFAVGGLVVLLGLVVAGIVLFFDINAHKPRLEAAASEALGMEVRIGGRMGIALFPGLSVTLDDVHVRHREADLASAKTASLGIDLLPLLKKEVRVTKIALKHARIAIERERGGKFSFEKLQTAAGRLRALDLGQVSVSDGTLVYTDKQSGEGFEAAGCSMNVYGLRISGAESADLMKNLSLSADVACGHIRKSEFTVSDLKFSVDGKNGILDFKPVTMRVFDAHGSGSVRADFSGAVPLYHILYSLPKFHVEQFFKALSPQKVADGPMDFSADLSMRGKTQKEMRQTMKGHISLRGEKLTLHGGDLDRQFSRFESSQNFNVVDVAAVFFAGPIGLAVTKGYNFATLFQGSEGSSEIRTLVSEWKVEHGVAQAQDIAMATNQNRIALKGGLDFVNEQFNDVTVAVVDARGCAKLRQKIHGTFQKPVVDKPNVLQALAGPALRLLKKGEDVLSGGACEVFYDGSVAPPK